jgi:hypothetical protein
LFRRANQLAANLKKVTQIQLNQVVVLNKVAGHLAANFTATLDWSGVQNQLAEVLAGYFLVPVILRRWNNRRSKQPKIR